VSMNSLFFMIVLSPMVCWTEQNGGRTLTPH
jgi:hypothetical protein